MKTRKFVFTRNRSQYNSYLLENNLTPKDAIYLHDIQQLRGISDIDVVFYGEYKLNPLYKDLDTFEAIEHAIRKTSEAT